MRDRVVRAIENYVAERAAGTRPEDDRRLKTYADAGPEHDDEIAVVPYGMIGGDARWLVCALEEARMDDPPRREADDEWALVDEDTLVDVEAKR